MPVVRDVAERAFGLIRGRWPKPLGYLVLSLTSRSPETFTEKVRARMAFDRRAELSRLADKVEVRSYIQDRVGDGHLPRLFAVILPSLGERIPWDALPEHFVAKAAHGSGAVVLVSPHGKDWIGPARRLRWEKFAVSPQDLDRSAVEALVRRWSKLRYEHSPPTRFPEWIYRDIPPRVLFEELLTDGSGVAPRDFKFFMFDGECALIQVDEARFEGHRRDLFDSRWVPVDATLTFPRASTPLPAPPDLAAMISIAEKLSAGWDFMRVDLYAVDGRIVVGELTMTPGGGREPFKPRSFDGELGAKWRQAFIQ
ncbi:MAG: ATP-grasp fold amidoligase family protein [Ilumatobacteraceae bacterium]